MSEVSKKPIPLDSTYIPQPGDVVITEAHTLADLLRYVVKQAAGDFALVKYLLSEQEQLTGENAVFGTYIDPDWTPTAESVNSLPDPVRMYIHALETNCDPAGLVAENALLRDQTKMLDAMVARLKRGNSCNN